MADGARLLPAIGAVLFIVPLLWKGGGDGSRTAWVMTYVFIVWAGLAAASGVLSRYLASEDDTAEPDGDG